MNWFEWQSWGEEGERAESPIYLVTPQVASRTPTGKAVGDRVSGLQGPKHSLISYCFPRCISRELGQIRSGASRTQTDMLGGSLMYRTTMPASHLQIFLRGNWKIWEVAVNEVWVSVSGHHRSPLTQVILLFLKLKSSQRWRKAVKKKWLTGLASRCKENVQQVIIIH